MYYTYADMRQRPCVDCLRTRKGVNPCNDPKMNRSVPVAGIGSGSCWEDPSTKGKYIINYSEDIKGNPYGQQIRFSTSTDLQTWTPVTTLYVLVAPPPTTKKVHFGECGAALRYRRAVDVNRAHRFRLLEAIFLCIFSPLNAAA